MKPPEEIAQDIILEFMFLKTKQDMGWAGMDLKMAIKCAIIHVKRILDIIPNDYWNEVLTVLEAGKLKKHKSKNNCTFATRGRSKSD